MLFQTITFSRKVGRLIKGKFKLSTDLLSSSVGKKYFIKVNILRLGVCKGGLTVEFGGR